MKERQPGEGRQDRWTQESGSYEGNGGSERAMTQTAQAPSETSQQRDRSSGNWTGYVVPYRYYGPGYRGVGYYSVFYQGSGEESGGQADWDEAGQGSRSVGSGSGSGRQTSGGFAGRGPKGYQRSDDRIREEVSDALMADDRIDASEIEVQVKDCEVTLTGTVEDRWAKRLAEDVSEQVMGVRDVMNQIRVVSGQPGQRGQADQYGRTGQAGQAAQTGQSGQTTQSGTSGWDSQPSSGASATGSNTGEAQGQEGDANGRQQKAGSASR